MAQLTKHTTMTHQHNQTPGLINTICNCEILPGHNKLFTSKFCKAFENLIKIEGGYNYCRFDTGRATKFGISKKSYPNLDVRNLTIEEAKTYIMMIIGKHMAMTG